MAALLPLIITFGLMWALLIRPQQRRVRAHQDLVATISVGDEVITTGGIVGTIVAEVDDIITLEVAPDVSIRVLRSAIQTRIAAFPDPVDDGDAVDDEAFDEEFENEFVAEPIPEPAPAPATPSLAADATETPDVSYIPPPAAPPTNEEKA